MTAFRRLASISAFAVAVGGVGYSLAFVIGVKAESQAALTVSWVLLLVGGLVGTVVAAALYERLRDTDSGLALVGLVLGAVGMLGSSIHGAYDVALIIRPVDDLPEIPNPVDPRGMLTFGVTGLSVLVFSSLILQGTALPRRLGSLGVLLGALLVLVYLGRLIIFDPNNVVLLGVAAVAGLIVHPAWFVGLGRALGKAPISSESSTTGS